MSFVVAMDGRLDEAVRRAAHVELTRAIANLTLPESMLHAGVHEARKSFKRLRAFHRLVEASGPRRAAREIARHRDLARALAEAREAAAMVEALDRLVSGPADARLLAPLRARLVRARDDGPAGAGTTAATIAEAIAALSDAAAGIAGLPLPRRNRKAARLVGDGVARSLRRVQKALKRAQRQSGAEQFHDLRKRVKEHLYHLGLLRAIWPKPGSTRRAEVDALGERLGDLNDCDTMAALLAGLPADGADAGAIAGAMALNAALADGLRHHCLAEAARLFDLDADAVGRRIARRLRRAARRAGDGPDPLSPSGASAPISAPA